MVAAHPNRASIVDLHNSGYAKGVIARMLQVHPRTVRRAILRYEETDNTADRPRSGRPRTAVTPRNVNVVRKRIQRNPRKSLRQMARDLHISDKSVRDIVHDRLNCHSYRLQKSYALAEETKETRVRRCRELLRRAADNRHLSFVFSDEKLFTVDAVYNRQNDRVLSQTIQEANMRGRLVSKKAHPASVMVSAFISSDGKSPLVFVESGVKINQHYYLDKVLRMHLVPWLQSHFGNRPYTFQQDSAPAHKARVVQEWCKNNLADFVSAEEWPPAALISTPLTMLFGAS